MLYLKEYTGYRTGDGGRRGNYYIILYLKEGTRYKTGGREEGEVSSYTIFEGRY